MIYLGKTSGKEEDNSMKPGQDVGSIGKMSGGEDSSMKLVGTSKNAANNGIASENVVNVANNSII